MAVVEVTGNVKDHGGQLIPAVQVPELWFQPAGASLGADGLLPGVEVRADLDQVTGAFTAMLDNSVSYTPFLRWALNPAESAPERRSWGYARWELEFNPGPGGEIGALPDLVSPASGVVFGYGPPDAAYTDVIYVDISGVNPIIYGPDGTAP